MCEEVADNSDVSVLEFNCIFSIWFDFNKAIGIFGIDVRASSNFLKH